jgi:uncharacterized protein
MKIAVKVTPNSMQDLVKEGGVNAYGNRMLKIKTTASPEGGDANVAVIKIVSEYFKVKRGQVKILSGETARLKILEVDLPEAEKE